MNKLYTHAHTGPWCTQTFHGSWFERWQELIASVFRAGRWSQTHTHREKAEWTHTNTRVLHDAGDECCLILWSERPRWEGWDLLLRAISYRPKVQLDGIASNNGCIYSYAEDRGEDLKPLHSQSRYHGWIWFIWKLNHVQKYDGEWHTITKTMDKYFTVKPLTRSEFESLMFIIWPLGTKCDKIISWNIQLLDLYVPSIGGDSGSFYLHGCIKESWMPDYASGHNLPICQWHIVQNNLHSSRFQPLKNDLNVLRASVFCAHRSSWVPAHMNGKWG